MEVKIVAEKIRKIASFEKDCPIGSQDRRREKTEDRILWTYPLVQRIRMVKEQSYTKLTVILTLKLDTIDCHIHVNAIKKAPEE